eukprot:359459-Chlamydomonas_euryale.AAC.2
MVSTARSTELLHEWRLLRRTAPELLSTVYATAPGEQAGTPGRILGLYIPKICKFANENPRLGCSLILWWHAAWTRTSLPV